jgi:hypothetical protein
MSRDDPYAARRDWQAEAEAESADFINRWKRGGLRAEAFRRGSIHPSGPIPARGHMPFPGHRNMAEV